MAEALRSRLPPGQTRTEKWPVLHYGAIPKIDLAAWEFTVTGEVETPVRWTWAEFTALPRITVRSDIHCVTQWSRFDNTFEGVSCREVLSRVTPRAGVAYVMVHSYGGYTTNIELDALLDDDTLFAFAHDGRPLAAEHGGPCRLVVPKRYFWKSAKWVHGIELMRQNRAGFWEQNGYNMHADPWKEERFSDPWA